MCIREFSTKTLEVLVVAGSRQDIYSWLGKLATQVRRVSCCLSEKASCEKEF